MKTYIVYFEIYGKKMKTEVKAQDPAKARQQVIDKLIFHKVEFKDNVGDIPDSFKDVFGDIFKF
jgi:ASC-1-like (ASCH) protein